MNELILKKFEIKINSLTNLRTMFYSIAIVLTSGEFGLLFNINSQNLFWFVIGFVIDWFMIISIIKLSIRIDRLIKFIERS